MRSAVYDAVRMRAQVLEEKGAHTLRKLGARPATLRRSHEKDATPVAGRLLAAPDDPIPPSGEPPPPLDDRPPPSEEPFRGQR